MPTGIDDPFIILRSRELPIKEEENPSSIRSKAEADHAEIEHDPLYHND